MIENFKLDIATPKIPWICRFGWHAWGTWSEPSYLWRKPEFGFDPAHLVIRQTKACTCCNYLSMRIRVKRSVGPVWLDLDCGNIKHPQVNIEERL